MPSSESWLSPSETLDLSHTDMQEAYLRPADALQRMKAEYRNSLSPQDSAEFRRIAVGLRKVNTEVLLARIGRALSPVYENSVLPSARAPTLRSSPTASH